MSWRRIASSGTRTKTLPPPSFSAATTEPCNEKRASNNGRGTDDAFAVTKILEASGIPCFMEGISALIFYGAARGRPDWEIGVPTKFIDKAAKLLQTEPHSTNYTLGESWPYPTVSLWHTYHRFQGNGTNFYFILVPAEDVHMICEPANITRSLRGLPYPKLDVFIQSCLDTGNRLQLCDAVDGADLSEEWGEENLDLEGFNDVEWAKDMNKRGSEFDGKFAHKGPFAWDGPIKRRDMWQSMVRIKKDRLDWTQPADVFITQYRIIGDPDPWTILSDDY